jgi:hypothetical protein
MNLKFGNTVSMLMKVLSDCCLLFILERNTFSVGFESPIEERFECFGTLEISDTGVRNNK